MDNCPICGRELIRGYEYGSEYGLEESKYECEGHYVEIFHYGSTEVHIGDFSTGYSYNTDPVVRTRILEVIQLIAEHYKSGGTQSEV